MNSNEILSPKLLKLQTEVNAGNTKALYRFWCELEKNSSPLIEPIDNDLKNRLVTFILKAEEGIEHFVLVSSIAGYELEKNIFTRLEETDIFYKSYTVPNKARTTYYIGKDIPLDFDKIFGDWNKYVKQCVPDPLNKKKFLWPKNPEVGDNYDFINSIFEMPDAPEQPWINARDEVPKGSLEMVRFKSKILDNERNIWIYTPHSYSKNAIPYHLLLTFDGFEYTQVTPGSVILDNLIAENKIPPTAAVFIGNAGKGSRDIELTCNESFARFTAEELIPWLQKNYNITENPAKIVAAGASYGGIAAAFMGLRYPQLIGNILSQSGSYWYSPENEEEGEWLIKQFINSDKLPLNFYLEVGKLESRENMISTNRHFRDILRCKGYSCYYSEFVGGHDYSCWRGTLAEGLIQLIGNNTQ